jgi:hypothetical protein
MGRGATGVKSSNGGSGNVFSACSVRRTQPLHTEHARRDDHDQWPPKEPRAGGAKNITGIRLSSKITPMTKKQSE